LAHFIEILQLSFCVMNYAHLVYGMQMASAARAWMYRQPQEDLENFLSGVNGFLNQAKADMTNCGVQAMLCPYIDCLNQKEFAQWEIIFIIWSHVVSQNITHVGINMVRKALMNSKQAA
jgi:acyl-homoserine lactone acylase PvdQ